MTKHHYKVLSSATGYSYDVIAEHKSEVREQLHRDWKIPYDFIDKNVKITNMGVYKNEKSN